MTVLLTNIWLVNRAGSETVIRDLSLGLLRRGHRPIVYAPALGESAEELIAKGIVVIDDLRKLAEPPDIIHAHHLIPCGEALIRFPQVPAIYTCHAFAHWAEAPARFPQIAAYVAVDEACRDRLVHSEGIDPTRVLVMPNAVDLTRIPARLSLTSRPRRAIAFGKAAAAPELRRACEYLGIEFAAIGHEGDNPSARPEQELVKADLVFGTARCALEALCCGCAVIVCDMRGSAGLITSENFEMLRTLNFGLRSLGQPVTVENCIQEIERYDPADATRVSERARRDADLETRLDEFESLYREVLDGSRRPVITPESHERAMADFLHENLPRRPADPRWPWLGEREDLLEQIQQLESQLTAAAKHLVETERAGANMQARLAASSDQAARAQQELADLNRSRLLRIGRFLRRIAGRPAKD